MAVLMSSEGSVCLWGRDASFIREDTNTKDLFKDNDLTETSKFHEFETFILTTRLSTSESTTLLSQVKAVYSDNTALIIKIKVVMIKSLVCQEDYREALLAAINEFFSPEEIVNDQNGAFEMVFAEMYKFADHDIINAFILRILSSASQDRQLEFIQKLWTHSPKSIFLGTTTLFTAQDIEIQLKFIDYCVKWIKEHEATCVDDSVSSVSKLKQTFLELQYKITNVEVAAYFVNRMNEHFPDYEIKGFSGCHSQITELIKQDDLSFLIPLLNNSQENFFTFFRTWNHTSFEFFKMIDHLRKNTSVEYFNEFTNRLYALRPTFFARLYHFAVGDSFDSRLKKAQECLKNMPYIMARNVAFIFSDDEVLEDPNGKISEIIAECLQHCVGTNDEKYLLCLLKYYERLRGERSASTSSNSSSSSQPPKDSHLYLFLGQAPLGKKGDDLYVPKRCYDIHVIQENISYPNFNSEMAFEANRVNARLEPATEKSSYWYCVDEKFKYPHMRQLGYEVLPGGSGTFVIRPDPITLMERWKELNITPEPFTVFMVEGVLSSREFVKAHWDHDGVYSRHLEGFHDESVHLEMIAAFKIDPRYKALREEARVITKEILDVCDFVMERCPSDRDRDLARFLEATAGIIYDIGTTLTIEKWQINLNAFKELDHMRVIWGKTVRAEVWRKAIREIVPNENEYTHIDVHQFWVEKRSCLSC